MPKIWGDDDEQVPEWNAVDLKGDIIAKAESERRGSRGFETNLETMVGLCSTCKHYVFIEDDQHQIMFSGCHGLNYDSPIAMTKRKRIRNCSLYIQKGQLGLQQLFVMATLIDPPEEAKIKGFVPNKTKENKDGNDKGNG